ncbi:MAG: toxin regulator [Gemella sp.]|nr:toxin regulator [Gemella sp.]
MKKLSIGKILIFIITAFLLLYIGGSATALTDANNKVEELTKKLETSEKERQVITNLNNNLTKEYNDYKEKMRPFEKDYEKNLEDKKKAEKEQEEKKVAEAKAKLAEIEKKKEEDAKKKLEEEKKGYETGITFENLARTPKEYIGKKVKLSGRVLQVSKGTTEHQLRVAIGGNYDTIVMVGYTDLAVEKNVLDNDYITFYGKSVGEITYEATSGASITIPGDLADKIEF